MTTAGLVSIIVPSTGRSERLEKCLRGLLDTIDRKTIEIIAVIDHDEMSANIVKALAKTYGCIQLDYSEEYRGNVKAWNDGLAHTDGEYIVFAADDLTFQKGWLEESLIAMAKLPGGSGLVGFNDGHWNAELSTHYIMHRDFIIEVLGGVVAWEWYKHSFNDLETNERAKRAGRYAWAENAHVVHDHWTFGTRERDATDDRWLPDYDAARDMYEARKAAGFPNNFEPVIGPARNIHKKRIGWLSDIAYQYKGGAEMVSEELQALAPDGFEIVPCPAGQIAEDVDLYVIHNCAQYDASIIPLLEKKPTVKMIHDMWPHGDDELRKWLLDHAFVLIFVSDTQRQRFKYPFKATFTQIPAHVDMEPYKKAAEISTGRSEAVWLGRMWPGKGIKNACKWARDNKVFLDFYGYGPAISEIEQGEYVHYCGELPYDSTPGTLAKYQTFVFLPDAIDTFSRTTIEAWAAGCELVINQNVGALNWLLDAPNIIEQGAAIFWDVVGLGCKDG